MTLTAANVRTILLFLRVRATNGRALSDEEAQDGALVRLLALIDAEVRNWERDEERALTLAIFEATHRSGRGS